MKFLTAVFYYGFIIPISHLPFRVLYVISDGLYFIIYRVIGYRKKVVLQNIAQSFPDKTAAEHVQIVNGFYRHLCDLVVESLKVFTISQAEVNERMKVVNPDFIDRFYDQGKNVIMAGGHYNNWELFAVAIDASIKHKAVAIYKPLSSLFFDKKMRESRSKYGLEMISTRKVEEEFKRANAPLRTIIFGFDQSPRSAKKCYWSTFLNQDTAMLFGVEKYAKEYNFPVVYARINKVSRGHYITEFVESIEDPLNTGYGEITKRMNDLLEKDILKQPEYWLWSHKRWKHKCPTS
ncbi:MAG: lysophospholipid acyltransferase family protein [Cytophagales bacterium]|nr:lysophospholipid acyltransferase family protein [Cytophagales bacterium]